MIPRATAFLSFLIEREEIRLRKEAGLPRPWTKDKILNTYKFTNVRRENDRTSRAFAEFYKANITEDTPRNSILLNCGIARYFGTSEFLLSLGWQDTFDEDRIINHARERIAKRERVFTGAYVITNQGISAPKEYVVTHYFLKGLWEAADDIIFREDFTDHWESFIERLMLVEGFGGSGFMAKEVTLDYIMATGWDPVDFDFWSPSGPGARRGAARVMGIDDPLSSEGMVYFRSADKTLEIMRELFKLLRGQWPVSFAPLRLTDIQFQLCEFDKYERVRLGQGKPRSRYR